ncbi:MAG: hypothetical protein R2862_09975 [Thermoanaerobaculia bacterium]
MRQHAAAALAIRLAAGALLFRSRQPAAIATEGAGPMPSSGFCPEGTTLVSGLALSPDGRQLASSREAGTVGRRSGSGRRFTNEARELGTGDARYPFWSPDSRRLSASRSAA